MKMEWKKPVLEVLDVKMTMANARGTKFDGDYSHDQEPVLAPDGSAMVLS